MRIANQHIRSPWPLSAAVTKTRIMWWKEEVLFTSCVILRKTNNLSELHVFLAYKMKWIQPLSQKEGLSSLKKTADVKHLVKNWHRGHTAVIPLLFAKIKFWSQDLQQEGRRKTDKATKRFQAHSRLKPKMTKGQRASTDREVRLPTQSRGAMPVDSSSTSVWIGSNGLRSWTGPSFPYKIKCYKSGEKPEKLL